MLYMMLELTHKYRYFNYVMFEFSFFFNWVSLYIYIYIYTNYSTPNIQLGNQWLSTDDSNLESKHA